MQRLCDDRRMQAQIAAAIDARLRADGPHVLGDRLVSHATAQKAALPPAFYDSYYKVLTEYLEEINYGAMKTATPAPNDGGAGGVVVPVGGGGNGAGRSRRERLAELKELLDDGLISPGEFDTRRREILAEV